MDLVALGEALTRVRQAQNLTQAALARKVGCDRSVISKIENGLVKKPSLDVLRRCEEALHLTQGYLFDAGAASGEGDGERQGMQCSISDSFPYGEVNASIRQSTKRIRILQTWVPDIQPLLTSLGVALQKGSRLQVLILDPTGDHIGARLDSLRIRDTLYPWIHAYKLLQDLSDLVETFGAHACEVRCYERTPAIELYATERTSFVGFFWNGGMSLDFPHVVTPSVGGLGLRAGEEFETLWTMAGDTLTRAHLESLRQEMGLA